MQFGDDEFKRKLDEYLTERKPKSFANMMECLSWHIQTRKEFMLKMNANSVGNSISKLNGKEKKMNK